MKRLTAGIEADGFTQEIVRTKQPVLIADAQSDPRPVRSAMLEYNVRSMLGVPMVLRGEVIGLLFLDNEDLPHTYTPEEQELSLTFANLVAIAISQSQLTAELRSTLSTAAQQNAMLRRAAVLEDRLADLMLDGANLCEIAEAVTEVTGKPCSIHDAEFRRLAHANPADVDGVRMLDPAALRTPAVRDALRALTARRPSVLPPLPAVGLHRRSMIALVRVSHEKCGYLVLTEHGTRFGAQDVIVARRTATIIALELSGKQRAADADSHAAESLARDLLHGSDESDSLNRRADYHGLPLAEPHVVVLFSPREQATPTSLTPARVGEELSAATGGLRSYAADVEKGVAVVLELPELEHDGEALRRVKEHVTDVARSLTPDGAVSAAISTVCRNATEYPAAYEQTRQISRGISTFGTPGKVRVLAAGELGAGRLLLATADRDEADRFVRDTLGPLLDLEDAGVHELFVTLQAFFGCSRSVRRAATELDVHENTIRYRLARIEKITGLDVLMDGDVQLAVQMALMILRLEDRLGPSADRGLGGSAKQPSPAS